MSRPSICLGYKSALEVARVVKPGGLTVAKGGGRMLPDSAPSSTKLRSVLERLEANHPGLHLERPVHLVVRKVSNYRGTELGKFHACTKAFSGKSLLRLDDVLVSTPELALVQAATQEKNLVALLELGWELCGSYRTARTSLQHAYQVDPLTTTKSLQDFASRNASLDGAGKVARILPYFADGSASPRETKLALILGLPMMHGGQGLGIPSMNHEVFGERCGAGHFAQEELPAAMRAGRKRNSTWSTRAKKTTRARTAASAIQGGRTRSLPWAGPSSA